MSERRRLAVVLLAASGALIGHAAAYSLAGATLGSNHAYLESSTQILVPLGLAAAALMAVRAASSAGGLSGAALRVRHLATVQMALFAAQEIVEGSTTLPALHVNPATLTIGLVVQIPIAWALVRLVSWGASAIRALTPDRSPHSHIRVQHVVPTALTLRGRYVDSWASRRGPPVGSEIPI